jgi:predicted TIM-barrel fold metal-dependent hydrolase
MAKNGFKVMDSDMHIIEPADLWDRYIDAEFKGRVVGLTRYERDLGVALDGENLSSSMVPTPRSIEGHAREREAQNPKYKDGDDNGWDAHSQVRAMDQEGIDVAILYPSRALFTLAYDGMDPKLAAAIGRAYNDWMYDFCKPYPNRLFGAGHIAPHDVDAAVAETRRCVEELGFKTVFMRPNIVNGISWHDPYYDPLWAACERLGIPVGFHEGGRPPHIAQVGDREFSTSMLHHTCSHSMGMMLATVSFCGGGILERFPRLRVAFLEGNCSWVPWLMWRMDEHQEWKGFEHPELTLKPSEYFKRQCFASVECDEWPSKYVDDAGFGHTVVFSTDYPHPDSKYPHAVDAFLQLDLADQTKRKYLWDNCARLYDFSD